MPVESEFQNALANNANLWDVNKNISTTAEIARDAWNGHSRSLKVIRCCTNRRGIYDFLLALDSNLTSRRLGVGGHALVSGCPEHWIIQP